MTEKRPNITPDFRIQDMVARLSHVKLRESVLVMRSTSMALRLVGEEEAADRLDYWLLRGAQLAGMPAKLSAKPDEDAKYACQLVHQQAVKDHGFTAIRGFGMAGMDPYVLERAEQMGLE